MLPKERLFLLKAYENKLVTQTELMYKACFTAFYNASRPKRKKALKLWTKPPKKANMQEVNNAIDIVKAVEAKEGDSWIRRVYQANGLKYTQKRGKANGK